MLICCCKIMPHCQHNDVDVLLISVAIFVIWLVWTRRNPSVLTIIGGLCCLESKTRRIGMVGITNTFSKGWTLIHEEWDWVTEVVLPWSGMLVVNHIGSDTWVAHRDEVQVTHLLASHLEEVRQLEVWSILLSNVKCQMYVYSGHALSYTKLVLRHARHTTQTCNSWHLFLIIRQSQTRYFQLLINDVSVFFSLASEKEGIIVLHRELFMALIALLTYCMGMSFWSPPFGRTRES